MDSREYVSFVDGYFPEIGSVDDFYSLFRGLGYPSEAILDSSYKRRVGEFGFAKEEEEKIANVYTVLSIEKNLNVFLVETKSKENVTVRFLRYLAKVFSDHYMHFLLIVTGDFRTVAFVLPDFEKKGVGEVKLKIIRLQVDVSDLYYTDKQTIAGLGLTEQEENWRDIWLKWRDAFSVKRVTDEFFKLYAGAPDSVFFKVRNSLIRQKISRKDAHEFALQFLNRVMFVYFVAKKRWLNNDTRFMRWLWRRYLSERNNGRAPADSFYEKWLKTIFLEAFNNKFTSHVDLPEDVNQIFYTVPYLNGGLFREEDIDKLPVKINDDLFKEVFEFFERYNFTIKEDLPFDVEVAVDPQMIGYVYESLANVAEEIYDRNDLGIFYTPRVEVDFMCRRSIVEYFYNHLPNVPKELWYKLVFDEKTEIVEKQLGKLNIWYDLEETLDNISVVDPACGSGAFLVGMLHVLTDMYKIVNKNLGRSKPDFEIKKRIVGKSLYGVDVMPWAVHAAELRLWLQLVVESPLEIKDLRTYPLLPNLNMNLRVGDSLVQEIGGMTLHLRDQNLSKWIKKKLVELKQEKENYINNVPTAKFKRKEELQKEEIRVFQEIIEERLQIIKDEIKSIRSKIKGEKSQKTLSGEKVPLTEEKRKRIEQLQKQIERYNREEYELKKIRENLVDPEKKPFVWEIDFAEVFGEKAGFDIVIGNPPYVTRTYIGPPNKMKSEVSKKDRDIYKEKLLESVKNQFPIITNLSKMSDYYIYFYFQGLSLLNEKGVFCFITSNSWLDVGYGKDLQEFLLKYVPILAIFDNPKRSFEHADINTIIALFGPAKFQNLIIEGLKIQGINKWTMLSHIAKFVMFKKPFEEVINSKNLIKIDDIKIKIKAGGLKELTKNITTTQDYRVFPILQEDLLEDGWEYPKDDTTGRFNSGTYEVNKWGGKYIRAPDVFFEKVIPALGMKIKDKAKVSLGLTSGYNPFFYIKKQDAKKLGLEKKYLMQLIKSPRDCLYYVIDSVDSGWYVLSVKANKKKVDGVNVLKYINKGEKEKIPERPYFQNKDRDSWYKLDVVKAPLIQPYDVNVRHFTALNNTEACIDKRLVCIYPKHDELYDFWGFLNSTIGILIKELFGKTSLGQGALDNSVKDVQKMLITANQLPIKSREAIRDLTETLGKREVMDIFTECGIDPSKPIREQEPNPLDDRKILDEIIFNELSLTKQERKEIYWTVCELVRNRLEKAESLKGKKNE